MAVTPDTTRLASNPLRGLITAGSGAAPARGGVECLFTYNGVTINDRSLTEQIRVEETSGFAGDVPIRDESEQLPGDHGGIPMKSLYDERTMTLRGKIRAYSIQKLRDMEDALHSVFNDIEAGEQPLVISSPFGTSVRINARATALTGGESQQNKLYVREFLITLKASNPRLLTTTQVQANIIPNLNLNGQFESDPAVGWAVTANGALVRSTNGPEFGTYLGFASFSSTGSAYTGYLYNTQAQTVAQGETYYFRARVDGSNSGGKTITMGYYDQNGTWRTAGLAGVGAGTTKTTDGMQYLEGILTIPLGVTSVRQAFSAAVLSGSPTTFLIDSAAWAAGSAPFSVGIAPLDNAGSFASQAIVALRGPFGIGGSVVNLTNGTKLVLAQAIPSGQTWTFDTARRLVTDSSGANKFNARDVVSKWITLKKRSTNTFMVEAGPGGSTSSQATIYSSDTWI